MKINEKYLQVTVLYTNIKIKKNDPMNHLC